MATIRLALVDKDKVVKAHQGDVIEITLDENPTTAYLWRWHADSEDKRVLEQENPEEGVFNAQGTATGAGGRRTLWFKVKDTGTASLRLENRREWEKEPIKRYGVTIQVEPFDSKSETLPPSR